MSKRKRPRSQPVAEKTAAEPQSRRQLLFTDQFLQDLQYWVQADPRLVARLLKMVELVVRDPFRGIGKPEPLKRLPDTWSRRLNEEHRLTYRVTDEHVDFLQARFHYEK